MAGRFTQSKVSTYTIGVDESSFTVEFTLTEVTFVDNAIGESKLALAFLPVVRLRPLVLTA